VRGSLMALLALHCSVGVSTLPVAAADRSVPEDVTLVLSEYRFSPNHLVFRHGVPYRLLLENRGRELHEFTAPAFFQAITLEAPESLAPGGSEVVLGPGELKALVFMAAAAGRYPLSCADHDWAGMTGDIVVE
jgi:uncharacterized cupredoxin-like copper-binding protein